VFLNTLTGILGDYATIAAMETFTASNSERHPTDLAMLRGARLVSAAEEGRRWAEAKIKALTGGDPITAGFMRQDFFTYTPQFKLLIAGNHKPGPQGVDEAIRRRLNLIPFAVTIPPGERDLRLPEKLRAEWPAILRWAIDGCLEWRRRGLDQPKAVRAATEEYLADEDAFGKWLEECCQRSTFAHETAAELFASWRKYCDRRACRHREALQRELQITRLQAEAAAWNGSSRVRWGRSHPPRLHRRSPLRRLTAPELRVVLIFVKGCEAYTAYRRSARVYVLICGDPHNPSQTPSNHDEMLPADVQVAH
jgi:phage/plasmid-associated DNA primase